MAWLVLIAIAVLVYPLYTAVTAWSAVCNAPQRRHWRSRASSAPHSPIQLSRKAGVSGFMLFDIGIFSKEKFMVESTFELLSDAPPEVFGLEWQPKDGRAVGYLKPPEGRLKNYFFAGNGYSSTDIENIKDRSFDDTPITFLEWPPSIGSLSLGDEMVDVVLISAHAADALKPKGLQLVLQESARVLKPAGQLIFCREEGEGENKPLPKLVEALYTVNVTKSEGTLVLRQLLPKPNSSYRVRAKSKARARAAPSAGARPSTAPKLGNSRASRSR